LVPLIVTEALIAPVAGENPVIAGVGNTSKFVALATVIPLLVTEIGPSVAPAGTITVILVADDDVIVALIPLKN
jgi:hypothetical protein